MNTTHTLTVGGQSIPLDPPKPPRKPDMLLWVDVETTGISRTDAKLLEIGMIVTGMDGATEHDRFVRPVRPDKISLYDIDLLTNQLAGYIHPDYLRELTNHRKLDLSSFRMADIALDVNPYKGHAGTHRVTDCITRDRNEYATYLDLLRTAQEETES